MVERLCQWGPNPIVVAVFWGRVDMESPTGSVDEKIS